jgi:hypothetical protein
MTWSARRIRTVIALWLLLALSLVAAWGRKPPKGEEVKVTLRRISSAEVMAILLKFPWMVPDWLTPKMSDTNYVAPLFPFTEVVATSLRGALPSARFYEGLQGFITPPHLSLIAIVGDKCYGMPDDFNRLLFDNDLKVDDKTITALAKTFVVLALGVEPAFGNPEEVGPVVSKLDAFRQITFLDVARARQVIDTIPYDAKLNLKIGEQVEEWYFAIRLSQFDLVSRKGAKGLIRDYQPVLVEYLPKR